MTLQFSEHVNLKKVLFSLKGPPTVQSDIFQCLKVYYCYTREVLGLMVPLML